MASLEALTFDEIDLKITSMVAKAIERQDFLGRRVNGETYLRLLNLVLGQRESLADFYKIDRARQEAEQLAKETTLLTNEVSAALRNRDIPFKAVIYNRETRTCDEKAAYWQENEFEMQFPKGIGIMKSLLFKYKARGRDHYIMVCTLGDHRVDTEELKIELRMSGQQAKSLVIPLFDNTDLLLKIGQEQGAVSPLLSPRKLAGLECVYFTGALMKDALEHPQKVYDVPLTRAAALLVNPAPLFSVLNGRSEKYRTFESNFSST